jgi:hypothetical protein
VGRPPVMRRVALDFHSPEAPSPPQSVRGGNGSAMGAEGGGSARQLRSPILPDGRLGVTAGSGEVPATTWGHVPRSASAGGLRRSFLLHAFSSPLRYAIRRAVRSARMLVLSSVEGHAHAQLRRSSGAHCYGAVASCCTFVTPGVEGCMGLCRL